MLATSTEPEILDLRHFSAPALRPLLEEEAAKWQKRLIWDYSKSIELLLDYVNSRSLSGYVAMQRGRVVGYAFGVCEAAKAVLGDVYAFGEAQRDNPVCETLLIHLLEMLQATPGIYRVESQMLLFPDQALSAPFRAAGFRAFPRCFMVSHPQEQTDITARSLPARYAIHPWRADMYAPAAALIQAAYLGHTDAEINDQYRSFAGAQRFLHNIVNFPGCGTFDASHSFVLLNATGDMEGMVLCSRVRDDAAHITQLCIRPSLRGQGLGAVLLRHCLRALALDGTAAVSLTVTESNLQALRLYAREGFRTMHRFQAWVWEQ